LDSFTLPPSPAPDFGTQTVPLLVSLFRETPSPKPQCAHPVLPCADLASGKSSIFPRTDSSTESRTKALAFGASGNPFPEAPRLTTSAFIYLKSIPQSRVQNTQFLLRQHANIARQDGLWQAD
jgi:hypothetical protein